MDKHKLAKSFHSTSDGWVSTVAAKHGLAFDVSDGCCQLLSYCGLSPVRALAPAHHTAERPRRLHSEHQWLLNDEILVLNVGSSVTSNTNVKKLSNKGAMILLRVNFKHSNETIGCNSTVTSQAS